MKRATTLLNLLLIALFLISSAGAATQFKILSTTPIVQQHAAPVQQLQQMQKLEIASPPTIQQTAIQTATASQQAFTILQKAPETAAKADDQIIQTNADDIHASNNTVQWTAAIKTDSALTGSTNAPKSINISTSRHALTRLSVFWGGLSEYSPELHFHSKTVSGDTTAGNTFTVSLTAVDSDDYVTRISLARSPYVASDFDIRECPADVHSCTIEFELSEADSGAYTYMVKAKNARNQIINDAITVTVVEDLTADRFNFRTAAMDGEDYGRGVIDYVDSEIFVWGDDITGITLTGSPFATFSVPSNNLLTARYASDGYITDTDHFYFDSRLPTCSGPSCTFTADFAGETYTTTCSLIVYDYHYACTLSDTDGYSIAFDYRATTDPVGPNTIRRYNLIYPTSAPIVDFGTLDASFVEGDLYIIQLDDYVYDNDTADSLITWTASSTRKTRVDISSATHEAVITQANADWIGSEMIRFTATDPEGNSGSDFITVRVLQDDNDAPVIVAKDPDADSVNVGRSSSRMFSIDAIDPDYDLLTITWRKGADVVATNTFSYNYVDTDGVPRPLTVMVSDGSEEDSAAWDIHIVNPIGTVGGTVTDQDTGLPLGAVHVQLFNPGTNIEVGSASTTVGGLYSITVHEGTYDINFTSAGYNDLLIPRIVIYADEVTTQNAEMQLIPPPIGTLQGTVRDAATSATLEGVLVEALVETTVINSTSTNSGGSYGMDLLEGTYEVRFSKLGYQTLEEIGVVITTGATTTQNAALEVTTVTTGIVEGTVTNEVTGAAVSGALVEVLSGMTVVGSRTTGAGGAYSITVEAGTYDVRFSETGYKTETQTGVRLNAGATTTLNFEMMKWWDVEWQKKYPITVQFSSTYQKYNNKPFKLVFNSSYITMSDCQSDGGDVRIVNSTEDGIVEFNLASWTSTTGIVYVNEPLSNTADMTYYLYCNPTSAKTTTSITLDVLSLQNNLWSSWSMNGSSYTNETNNLGISARNLNQGVPNTIISNPGGYFGRNQRGNFTGAVGTNAFLMTDMGAIPAASPITVSCVATVKNIAAWGDGQGVFYFGRDSWIIGGSGFGIRTCGTAGNGIKGLIDDMGAWGGETGCVGSFSANGDTALITMTWDGTTQNAYFNNSVVSQSRSTGWNVMERIKVGGAYNQPGGDMFYFDECNVWTEVLSPAKVSTLYNSGNLISYPFYASPAYTVGPGY